jgi:hypothetical protein
VQGLKEGKGAGLRDIGGGSDLIEGEIPGTSAISGRAAFAARSAAIP